MWRLLQRFFNIFRSNANSAMDKMEDPTKMLDLAVDDMRAQHRKAKEQVAIAIAEEKRLKKDVQKKLDESMEWEEKAQRALKAGDEELAKIALGRKQSADSEYGELSTHHQKAESGVETVKTALMDLDQKIQDADRRKRVLVSRQKRAEATKTINDTLQDLSTADNGTTFGEMEMRIEQLEAEADASGDLAAMGPGSAEADINKKFKALESGTVDDALEAMKRKLALPEASDDKAAG